MDAGQAQSELDKIVSQRRTNTSNIKHSKWRFTPAVQGIQNVRSSFIESEFGAGMSSEAVFASNASKSQILSEIQTQVVDPAVSSLHDANNNFNAI